MQSRIKERSPVLQSQIEKSPDTPSQLIAAVDADMTSRKELEKLWKILPIFEAHFRKIGILRGFAYTVDDLGYIESLMRFMVSEEYVGLSAEQRITTNVFVRNLLLKLGERGQIFERGNRLEEVVLMLSRNAPELTSQKFNMYVDPNELKRVFEDLLVEEPVRAILFARALACGVFRLLYPDADSKWYEARKDWDEKTSAAIEVTRAKTKDAVVDLVTRLLDKTHISQVEAEKIKKMISAYIDPSILDLIQAYSWERWLLPTFEDIADDVTKGDKTPAFDTFRNRHHLRSQVASYLGSELADRIFDMSPRSSNI